MRVEPLSEATLPGLKKLFEGSHSSCFCRYWHFTGNKNEWLERCAFRPEENAAEMPATGGLVALEGDEVIGWMKLTPLAAVPKLRSLPVYRSLALNENAPAIGCMLVHPEHRHRGVARALISAAPQGALAFPRRADHPLSDEEAWQGPERAFLEAGFTPLHDVTPYPVFQLGRRGST